MSTVPPFDDNPFTDQSQGRSVVPAKQPQWEETGDSTGGVIPYKNPAALFAYYLGVFSLIPCFGLFLAVPALILGIVGLRNASRNPLVRGQVHAWIGIVMGVIFTLVWGGVIVFSIVASIASAR